MSGIDQVQEWTGAAQKAKEEAKIKIRKDKEEQITAATLVAKVTSEKSAKDAANAAAESQGGNSTVVVPSQMEPEILIFNPKFGIFAT